MILKCAVDPQNGVAGQVPHEILRFTAPSDGEYVLLIVHRSGAMPGWVQLTNWDYRPEHRTANGSIGNPGESASTGMLTVGAAHWNAVNTIESYSSQGPLPDGRIKPDIVGAACGETHTYDSLGLTFCGTSQASPHVAGMAALVRQAFPQSTPAQVVAYLKDNAQQRVSSPEPNNTWGHGFAVLPPVSRSTQAPAPTAPPCPTRRATLAWWGTVKRCYRRGTRCGGARTLNWSGSVPITMWQGITPW